MMLLRKCKHCGVEAVTEDELSLFKKNKTCKYGRVNICKKCNNVYNNKYTSKSYGVDRETYDRIMSAHLDCEICGSTVRLCYDHSHLTGAFRGVLCRKCNAGIGLLGDTEQSVQQALNYLIERGD